jgi:hypothetical protein
MACNRVRKLVAMPPIDRAKASKEGPVKNALQTGYIVARTN